MRYVKPIIQNITTTYDNIEYKKECYGVPTTISGMKDDEYIEYDADATYNIGDYAKIDELKRVYRCTADNTSGIYPPSDTTLWVDYGFINSYKMFAIDEQIGDSSIGADVVMQGAFNMLNTLAFIDIQFENVTITQTDNDTNEVLYSKTISGIDIGATDFAGYFYDEYTYKTRLILTDLVWHPNSTIDVNFTGDVSIGTLIIGQIKDLGITLIGTSLKFEDKSLIKDDTDTNIRSVVRYGHTRELTANIIFDNDNFNLTAQKITKMIGKNMLFIPTRKDEYNEMTNIAYIEDFDMPVDNFTSIESTMTLIGVVKNDNSN